MLLGWHVVEHKSRTAAKLDRQLVLPARFRAHSEVFVSLLSELLQSTITHGVREFEPLSGLILSTLVKQVHLPCKNGNAGTSARPGRGYGGKANLHPGHLQGKWKAARQGGSDNR